MEGILTPLYATYANILSWHRSTGGHPADFCAIRMLPYRILALSEDTLSFGTSFSPGTFSAQENLTSELLRFL